MLVTGQHNVFPSVALTPVIVTGHTACGGCIAAHSLPSDTAAGDNPLFAFLGPLMKLRASLGPDATIEDLMVANVKQGVENVCKSAVSVPLHGSGADVRRCRRPGA